MRGEPRGMSHRGALLSALPRTPHEVLHESFRLSPHLSIPVWELW